MAIYLTAGVSGAHLNPAVTIALWLFACFDKRKVVPLFLKLPAPLRSGVSLRASLLQSFVDFEQTHHIVRSSVESLDPQAFSQLTRILISLCAGLAVEMVITAILMG